MIMEWLISRTAPADQSATSNPPKGGPFDKAAFVAHVNALAETAQAEALAKRDTVLAEIMDEHGKDVASYSFGCKRFGDFLTVNIGRNGGNYSAAVNLKETRQIYLHPGHRPGHGRPLDYFLHKEPAESWRSGVYEIKTGAFFGGLSSPKSASDVSAVEPLDGGQAYVARPGCYSCPYRYLFYLDPKEKSSFGYVPIAPYREAQSGIQADLSTPDYPVYAVDDTVRLDGPEATIFAPFGCGQAVYDAIMKEIRRGSPRRKAA